MRGRERVAVGLLGGAVALGALGDLLFHGRPVGLNAGLFAAAFVLALAALLRLGRVPLHQGRRLMAAPLAWHESRLLLATNLLALIARTNLARPHVDATYLGRLSDDAVPVLIDRLPSLAPGLRRSLASELLAREPASGGVLAWNASRSHAAALLRAHRAEFERLAGAGG